MNGPGRLAILALIFAVSACAPTTVVTRKSGKGPIEISGLNILYIDAPMLKRGLWRGAAADPTPPYAAAKNDDLHHAVTEQFPARLAKRGVPATLKTISPGRRTPVADLKKLFPGTSMFNHLLIIVPQYERTFCEAGHCDHFPVVSMSLKTPLEREEMVRVDIGQSSGDPTDFYAGILAEMTRVVAAVVVVKSEGETK